MRIQEHVILSALQKGACIKTFYRASARAAGPHDWKPKASERLSCGELRHGPRDRPEPEPDP